MLIGRRPIKNFIKNEKNECNRKEKGMKQRVIEKILNINARLI